MRAYRLPAYRYWCSTRYSRLVMPLVTSTSASYGPVNDRRASRRGMPSIVRTVSENALLVPHASELERPAAQGVDALEVGLPHVELRRWYVRCGIVQTCSAWRRYHSWVSSVSLSASASWSIWWNRSQLSLICCGGSSPFSPPESSHSHHSVGPVDTEPSGRNDQRLTLRELGRPALGALVDDDVPLPSTGRSRQSRPTRSRGGWP